MVKCCWCAKEEKYNRKNVKYICLNCTVYTMIGYDIAEAIRENKPLDVVEIKDSAESLLDTYKRISDTEQRLKQKTG